MGQSRAAYCLVVPDLPGSTGIARLGRDKPAAGTLDAGRRAGQAVGQRAAWWCQTCLAVQGSPGWAGTSQEVRGWPAGVRQTRRAGKRPQQGAAWPGPLERGGSCSCGVPSRTRSANRVKEGLYQCSGSVVHKLQKAAAAHTYRGTESRHRCGGIQQWQEGLAVPAQLG